VHLPSTSISYTLSLHDALPISRETSLALLSSKEGASTFVSGPGDPGCTGAAAFGSKRKTQTLKCTFQSFHQRPRPVKKPGRHSRSEEHTSELQSRVDLVGRLSL